MSNERQAKVRPEKIPQITPSGIPEGLNPPGIFTESDATEGPEALLIRHTGYEGKELILVTGSDERGLMYGLLDIADRIGWADDAKNPFEKVKNISEKPEVVERALSIYTMNKAVFESFFYDEFNHR